MSLGPCTKCPYASEKLMGGSSWSSVQMLGRLSGMYQRAKPGAKRLSYRPPSCRASRAAEQVPDAARIPAAAAAAGGAWLHASSVAATSNAVSVAALPIPVYRKGSQAAVWSQCRMKSPPLFMGCCCLGSALDAGGERAIARGGALRLSGKHDGSRERSIHLSNAPRIQMQWCSCSCLASVSTGPGRI